MGPLEIESRVDNKKGMRKIDRSIIYARESLNVTIKDIPDITFKVHYREETRERRSWEHSNGRH